MEESAIEGLNETRDMIEAGGALYCKDVISSPDFCISVSVISGFNPFITS
jgi:hypothetical protein